MACCAFAAFLLMQLLAPFVWLRDRLFGAPAERTTGAAAWVPGEAALPGAVSGTRTWRRGLLLVLAVEVAVLAAGFQAVRTVPALTSAGTTLTDALHASWCGSGPLATGAFSGD